MLSGDFIVRRLHRSLCFHSYRNRDILHVILTISLFPATKLEIKSQFYDSKHDILLESRGMNLFIEILETKSQPLSYEAIFAVWLVVNYKFLCCGPHGLLLQVSKAMFCDHSQACIDMSIKLARLHSTHADFCFTDILKLKFI